MSYYLAKDKDGKQLALYDTPEHAWEHQPTAHELQIWSLDEKTGQIYPTNGSICRLEIVEKEVKS